MTRFLLCFLIFISIGLNAQVGINTNQPNELAALDIKSIINEKNGVKDTVPQGILIPRLTSKQINTIDTQKDLDAANSLLVYNLDEECYNFFSKKEKDWISLCSDGGTKAVYTFVCKDVLVSGTYIEEKDLDESNYLTVKLNVSKSGAYTLSGTSSNGYYFTTSGEFLTTGDFTVKLLGAGKPIAKQTDQIDIVDLKGGNTQCSVSIQVEEKTPLPAKYTLNCEDIKDYGLYELGKPLDMSHYLELTVNVNQIGSWEIWSNTVDGISFSGNGIFTTTGSQTIKVTGTGVPDTKENKKMSLLIKNTGDNNQELISNCSKIIRMTLPSKLISCIGSAESLIAKPDDNSSNVYIYKLYSSQYNFGTSTESIIKMHPAKCQKSEINPNNKPSVSKSAITTALTTIPSSMASTHKKADALFLSYSAGLEDDAAAAEVMEYLDKGGVVVLLSSQVLKQPTFNGAKTVVTVGTGNLALMKMLFGEQVTLIEGVYEGIHTWKLPKGNKDDVILDGPFGDIRGQYLTTGMALPIEGGSFTTPFTNGCISVSYDNISASKLDWVITATGKSHSN